MLVVQSIQEVEKHFVQDLGGRPQCGAYWEDYEEGGGENDTIMDLLHFGDNENWLSSLVGGQSNGLNFELSEYMKALAVGGRHFGQLEHSMWAL